MQSRMDSMRSVALALLVATLSACTSSPAASPGASAHSLDDVTSVDTTSPYVVVLGIAQDGGVPQTGSHSDPAFTDPTRRRLATSLGLVDPRTGARWMFEATPDFKWQLWRLDRVAPRVTSPGLDGIFLTHAHIGHYTGLMLLGHESIGARAVPVYAMPRMAQFLRSNGPWDQLVRYENIALRELTADEPMDLAPDLRVVPMLVPHRQEYSEVVAYRIEGPTKTVLFLPDIDSWREWDETGTRLEDVLAEVDIAYLDATFFADGEIPGRDMSGFPHPFIRTTMDRLAELPESERAKVRFIHLNHTNPALDPESDAHREIRRRGFRVADETEIVRI